MPVNSAGPARRKPESATALAFVTRAMRSLGTAWLRIGNSPDDLSQRLHQDLEGDSSTQVRRQVAACIEGRGGEISARARAARLGHAYLSLSDLGRRRFLEILAKDFDVDYEAVRATAHALTMQSSANLPASARALREMLNSPRLRVLKQFNTLPEGLRFLVDMRATLVSIKGEDPKLEELESELRDLLIDWFDVGFLELRRIDWNSPAILLEKLAAYEAVHEVRGWEDLKNRLDLDRRCFGFFHPGMRDEPLIFVEVALVSGMSDNIKQLLDENSPNQEPEIADTAIFYSINSVHRGLTGISFGGFLIKQVAEALTTEFPQLRNFATLSPIPGFINWLKDAPETSPVPLLTEEEARKIGELRPGGGDVEDILGLISAKNWFREEKTVVAVRAPLMRLCAHYLLEEKRNGNRAADPVAHFHLGNGARVERINWLADTSERGLRQSAGMMVNYAYKTKDMERNHDKYVATGRAAAVPAVRNLTKNLKNSA